MRQKTTPQGEPFSRIGFLLDGRAGFSWRHEQSLQNGLQVSTSAGCGRSPVMSRTGYPKNETGENDIPVAILEKLADFYHTSVDYILGRTDTAVPYDDTKNRDR